MSKYLIFRPSWNIIEPLITQPQPLITEPILNSDLDSKVTITSIPQFINGHPTRTTAIKTFLTKSTHSDLATLYTPEMEVQVNVAQDGGERVENDYMGRTWHSWSDHTQTWYTFRIPKNASTEPNYEESEMTYDLAAHAEGIGMTGWNWKQRLSKWVAFDFDAISGHTEKHRKKLTDAELKEIQKAVSNIEWVTLRRSTSGKGLHIYVFLPPIRTENHTEHAAIARSILAMMSAITGYDFVNKVDTCGGNMWVWHRKMVGTSGLELLKSGSILDSIPPNWKEHINVISGKRRRSLPQFIIEEDEADRIFNELSSQYTRVRLDDEHRKLIDWLRANNAFWWWDQDHHMLVTHTIHLRDAHIALNLKGFFKTISTGSELGFDHNCFLFPLRKGSWSVRRYTIGTQEDKSWIQDGQGWTKCFYNREPDLETACRTYNGLEDTDGGFIFAQCEMALKASQLLGVNPKLPHWIQMRETKLKQHRDGRLIFEIKLEAGDHGDDMEGWIPKKGVWKRIFSTKTTEPNEVDVNNYDDLVRHLVTEAGDDYGWVIRSEGNWRSEPLVHVKTALESLGITPKDTKLILGSSIFRAWTLVNRPFQKEEHLENRQWNRNAPQLRFSPSLDTEDLKYPTWLSILEHCGTSLDDALKINLWAKANGILKGSDYLKCWLASLFQEPLEPLPYLFFFGPSNSGKSIFHEALSLLVTSGVVRADSSLINSSGFNGELESSVLCVVEETDLRQNRVAYNRIKDWVTSRLLPIHKKRETPYSVPNTTHWVQCSNDHNACPVFSGDTRITMMFVDLLDSTKLIPKKQIIPMLEKEASDFLTALYAVELPPSHDRLNVPCIITDEKRLAEQSNRTLLEIFLEEQCYYVPGKITVFSDFHEAFLNWLEPSQTDKWSKIKVGRELPPQYPHGRLSHTSTFHVGNLSLIPKDLKDECLNKIILKDGKLVAIAHNGEKVTK